MIFLSFVDRLRSVMVLATLAGALLVTSLVTSAAAQTRAAAVPRTPDKHPDFQGVWNSTTGTPVERPAEYRDKAFFTPAEAAEWAKKVDGDNAEGVFQSRGIGTYNVAFRELTSVIVKTMRTSMITDPPDGRLPALTPAAAAELKRRRDLSRRPGGVEDMGLQDQCLMFPTGAPPMTPYSYNSNFQVLQTKDTLAIQIEMPHDTRIIPLDGRAHLPQSVRLWYGDSVGHWEGDTLVVDTTNFNDKASFFGSDRNMHVVERFSFYDAETILYKWEVEDPTAFTKPFKGEQTINRGAGPVYEYACHEGNHAVEGVLGGMRAEEAAEAAKHTK
jgi:hypothetical protein